MIIVFFKNHKLSMKTLLLFIFIAGLYMSFAGFSTISALPISAW